MYVKYEKLASKDYVHYVIPFIRSSNLSEVIEVRLVIILMG